MFICKNHVHTIQFISDELSLFLISSRFTVADKVDVSKPKSEEDGSTKEEADPKISRTHSCWSWEDNPIRLMIIKFFRCEKKIHGPTH